MEMFIQTLVGTVIFAILGPVIGCLLAGADRIISARMQGRVGPKLLQPYWDVRKLMTKERASVNYTEATYINLALVFALISGGIFFAGGNFLLCVFTITLSSLFFIIAGYSTRSPFSEVGAQRETLQVMSYEPMVLLCAVGFYMATGTFNVGDALYFRHPAICFSLGVFLGLVFVLTIKLRKSPFDLSTSHHAHQELVKGITTEMSGPTLAKVEIMHWCENVLFLGWVGVFFVYGNPVSLLIAVVVALLIYFLEIFIDNNFARVKWQVMVKSAWVVALVLGGINLAILGLW